MQCNTAAPVVFAKIVPMNEFCTSASDHWQAVANFVQTVTRATLPSHWHSQVVLVEEAKPWTPSC